MIYPSARAHLVVNGSYWLVIYAALWWLLADGSGWGFGIFVIVAASGLSLALRLAPPFLNLVYLPRFLLFFFYELVVGAWDVARRALHPGVPIEPAWVSFTFNCANPRVRLVLSAMVGLLPGTLASRADATQMYLHVLDQSQNWERTVTLLETHLTRLLDAQTRGQTP